jgi:hypothetical protein
MVRVVNAAIGHPALQARIEFDGQPVAEIDSNLKPGTEVMDPRRLRANRALSFVGVKTYGEGFVLAPEEARELIAAEGRNEARIFPYLRGVDFNASPTLEAKRFVINFASMSLEEAGRWPLLLARVEERVKPVRDALPRKNAVNLDRARRWWQFAGRSPELHSAIAARSRCIVCARDPSSVCFAFQPVDQIFSEKIVVFALSTWTAFAVLQSRGHIAWATALGRTTGRAATPSYSSQRCFETFPFPASDPRTPIPAVESAGQAFYAARARFMVETDQGLTKTYNVLEDPDNHQPIVQELRRLTQAMDRAVLDAYGWTELDVPPYCHETAAEREAHKAFEAEVIDRLHLLNAERAGAEQREQPLLLSSPLPLR